MALYLQVVLLCMPYYEDKPGGIEELMPWSDMIQERCSIKKQDWVKVWSVLHQLDLNTSTTYATTIPIISVDVVAPLNNTVNNSGSSSRTGSRMAGMKRERNISDWGAFAEKLVYKQMKSDFHKVLWVSENAKKEGVNPDGRAELEEWHKKQVELHGINVNKNRRSKKGIEGFFASIPGFIDDE